MDFSKALKTGDKVFLVRGSSWGQPSYITGTVGKITPAGTINIQVPSSVSALKFQPTGRQKGDYGHALHIDEMPYTEREIYIAKCAKLEVANAALMLIVAKQFRYPSAEELNKEVLRLGGLLDTARALVEAV